MGFFPTTVKNLGQEIPCMGKYWEVDASHDYTQMGFSGKKVPLYYVSQDWEDLVNAFPCYSQSWKYLGDYILMLFAIL